MPRPYRADRVLFCDIVSVSAALTGRFSSVGCVWFVLDGRLVGLAAASLFVAPRSVALPISAVCRPGRADTRAAGLPSVISVVGFLSMLLILQVFYRC